MRIGEVAQRTGVSASTIRYYESIGLLPEPVRISGRREFAEPTIQRLGLIRLAQSVGFTLAEIREILPEESVNRKGSVQRRRAIRDKLQEIDRLIQRYRDSRSLLANSLDCSCVDTGRCNDHAHRS